MRYEKLIINILNPHIISDNSESARKNDVSMMQVDADERKFWNFLMIFFLLTLRYAFGGVITVDAPLALSPPSGAHSHINFTRMEKALAPPAQTTQHISSSFLVPLSHWIKFEKWTHIHELVRDKEHVKIFREFSMPQGSITSLYSERHISVSTER